MTIIIFLMEIHVNSRARREGEKWTCATVLVGREKKARTFR